MFFIVMKQLLLIFSLTYLSLSSVYAGPFYSKPEELNAKEQNSEQISEAQNSDTVITISPQLEQNENAENDQQQTIDHTNNNQIFSCLHLLSSNLQEDNQMLSSYEEGSHQNIYNDYTREDYSYHVLVRDVYSHDNRILFRIRREFNVLHVTDNITVEDYRGDNGNLLENPRIFDLDPRINTKENKIILQINNGNRNQSSAIILIDLSSLSLNAYTIIQSYWKSIVTNIFSNLELTTIRNNILLSNSHVGPQAYFGTNLIFNLVGNIFGFRYITCPYYQTNINFNLNSNLLNSTSSLSNMTPVSIIRSNTYSHTSMVPNFQSDYHHLKYFLHIILENISFTESESESESESEHDNQTGAIVDSYTTSVNYIGQTNLPTIYEGQEPNSTFPPLENRSNQSSIESTYLNDQNPNNAFNHINVSLPATNALL